MYKIRTVEPDSKTFLHHHLSYHLIHTNDTLPGRLLVPGTRYLVLVSYIPGHGPSTLDANKKHIYLYRYITWYHVPSTWSQVPVPGTLVPVSYIPGTWYHSLRMWYGEWSDESLYQQVAVILLKLKI